MGKGKRNRKLRIKARMVNPHHSKSIARKMRKALKRKPPTGVRVEHPRIPGRKSNG